MPQDPHLYGQPPPKRQKKEMAVSSTLSFTSQLTSLLAADRASAASTSAPARPKPTSGKASLFKLKDVEPDSKSKSKSKSKSDGKGKYRDTTTNKLNLKGPLGTEEDRKERARARRKMEAKARLYAAMKRGDYVAKEGEMATLVDFDRKWAEGRAAREAREQEAGGSGRGDDDSSSGDDHESDLQSGADDDFDHAVVEWEDEYGRQRQGTRAEKARFERRLARGQAAAAELEAMSARPKEPEKLIIGDMVQTGAFVVKDEEGMEALARKRDRSATPPEMRHYEADKEIRTKGVGFYAFSKDEATRTAEMAALGKERANTERIRREREEKVAARKKGLEQRKKELEERRRVMGEKRAKKMADDFLEGLEKDILGG